MKIKYKTQQEIYDEYLEFTNEVNCIHDDKTKTVRRYTPLGFGYDEDGMPYRPLIPLDVSCCVECEKRMKEEQ